MKNWDILNKLNETTNLTGRQLIQKILETKGIKGSDDIKAFFNPKKPQEYTPTELGINKKSLEMAVLEIVKNIKNKKSIVVYADYDADGITAGAIMWETIHILGGKVMPYIPHRVDEGYGLSVKGIDFIKKEYDCEFIVTVDHGVTAYEKVEYAKSLGINVVISDHHTLPAKLPDSTIVHTTKVCGAGVSYFLSLEILKYLKYPNLEKLSSEFLALATIGTISDLMPIVGINRSIVKYGLNELTKTTRPGLVKLFDIAGIGTKEIETYDVSHIIAPRLNAMGRLDHAMDALRLLCTKNEKQADTLSQKLNSINENRQELTIESLAYAKTLLGEVSSHKILFVSHESFNQGIIGLIAGKLTEEYYRPSIVASINGDLIKASARSINGFNIVEELREFSEYLLEIGGHPMACGFSMKLDNVEKFKKLIEKKADKKITDEMMIKKLVIDAEVTLSQLNDELFENISKLKPFGFGNYEPIFCIRNIKVIDAKKIGNGGKHLKLKVTNFDPNNKFNLNSYDVSSFDCIGFGMGDLYGQLHPDKPIDLAFNLDQNIWNSRVNLQLKLKDIRLN